MPDQFFNFDKDPDFIDYHMSWTAGEIGPSGGAKNSNHDPLVDWNRDMEKIFFHKKDEYGQTYTIRMSDLIKSYKYYKARTPERKFFNEEMIKTTESNYEDGKETSSVEVIKFKNKESLKNFFKLALFNEVSSEEEREFLAEKAYEHFHQGGIMHAGSISTYTKFSQYNALLSEDDKLHVNENKETPWRVFFTPTKKGVLIQEKFAYGDNRNEVPRTLSTTTNAAFEVANTNNGEHELHIKVKNTTINIHDPRYAPVVPAALQKSVSPYSFWHFKNRGLVKYTTKIDSHETPGPSNKPTTLKDFNRHSKIFIEIDGKEKSLKEILLELKYGTNEEQEKYKKYIKEIDKNGKLEMEFVDESALKEFFKEFMFHHVDKSKQDLLVESAFNNFDQNGITRAAGSTIARDISHYNGKQKEANPLSITPDTIIVFRPTKIGVDITEKSTLIKTDTVTGNNQQTKIGEVTCQSSLFFDNKKGNPISVIQINDVDVDIKDKKYARFFDKRNIFQKIRDYLKDAFNRAAQDTKKAYHQSFESKYDPFDHMKP